MANLSTEPADLLKSIATLSIEEQFALVGTWADTFVNNINMRSVEAAAKDTCIFDYLAVTSTSKVWREQWTVRSGQPVDIYQHIRLLWWIESKVLRYPDMARDFWAAMAEKYPLLEYTTPIHRVVSYTCTGCSTRHKELIFNHLTVGHKCEKMTLSPLFSRYPVAKFPLFPYRLEITFTSHEPIPGLLFINCDDGKTSRGVTKKSIVRKRNLSVPVTTIGVRVNEEEEAVRILHSLNN